MQEKQFRTQRIERSCKTSPAQLKKPLQDLTKSASLREEFIKALKVNDKSDRTIKSYCDAVKMFQTFIHKHPLHVTENDIRAFFYLIKEKNYAPRSFNSIYYGLRAFYEIFLPDVPLMASFRRHKTNKHLVEVLTRHEVILLLRHTDNLKHKAIIETLYSSGVRVSECVGLKFSDLDRKEMLIHVSNAKGGKDRYTILSPRCLLTLEQYYRAFTPKQWLFEGHGEKQLSSHMAEIAVSNAAKRAGIKKTITPHVLRHTFATHFLESDGRLPVLQQMLGHEHIRTTARYIHVCNDLIRTVKSPLDLLSHNSETKGGRQ
ncbi:Integrase [Chitinispirillum alkaliphilum]|nr:Integrase [Chitinispirillum alkaliphilum]